jgi:hypothetical protein
MHHIALQQCKIIGALPFIVAPRDQKTPNTFSPDASE